jgi:hypothetical protein
MFNYGDKVKVIKMNPAYDRLLEIGHVYTVIRGAVQEHTSDDYLTEDFSTTWIHVIPDDGKNSYPVRFQQECFIKVGTFKKETVMERLP